MSRAAQLRSTASRLLSARQVEEDRRRASLDTDALERLGVLDRRRAQEKKPKDPDEGDSEEETDDLSEDDEFEDEEGDPDDESAPDDTGNQRRKKKKTKEDDDSGDDGEGEIDKASHAMARRIIAAAAKARGEAPPKQMQLPPKPEPIVHLYPPPSERFGPGDATYEAALAIVNCGRKLRGEKLLRRLP